MQRMRSIHPLLLSMMMLVVHGVSYIHLRHGAFNKEKAEVV
jgi:hypothetical protein